MSFRLTCFEPHPSRHPCNRGGTKPLFVSEEGFARGNRRDAGQKPSKNLPNCSFPGCGLPFGHSNGQDNAVISSSTVVLSIVRKSTYPAKFSTSRFGHICPSQVSEELVINSTEGCGRDVHAPTPTTSSSITSRPDVDSATGPVRPAQWSGASGCSWSCGHGKKSTGPCDFE